MQGDDDADDASRYRKNVVRGIITNTLALLILYAITCISSHVVLPVSMAIGIQLIFFFFHGLPFTSERYYDLSGSLTHFAVVAISLVTCPDGPSPQQTLFGLLSVVWMVRLGTFLYLRILRDGRDPRFDELKKVKVRFLGAWTIQAVWVCLVQMPIILISSAKDTAPTGCYQINSVWLLVWLASFVFEAVADVQKFEFRSVAANRHAFITTGLWKYSRQPNYFGEIMMWTAAAGAVSTFGAWIGNNKMHFAWLSPVITIVLLLKVSGVPMLAKASEKKWGTNPEWLNYVKNTSLLVPWRPAKPLGFYSAPRSEML
mmetsp:Transcript_38235/g.63227  ORF Transcript_38235/g.63227 Transcript_38235/m.63227 type:complete len:315 (+) Transcript_38235:224-1168(+)|eukprot:CAMPEP_0119318020 /NCGR_PEP_ID=MMETSP1333-20130426/45325_1 /TAXON_ID=418940 /ORGANISM="Scyphosphaera apsteinii, Strain RCC1455" /LENGTH=314 /DNA_ID=CAMNT_0007324113 /DNA_START=214 /DNA_END=1158 /DNA_ORIENTATION=-